MDRRNIGQKGPESIRIDGLPIEQLPLGLGNEAKAGLKGFLETHKETQQNNIAAKFPQHKLPMLRAQVKECRGNIKRIKNFKTDLKGKIAEYRELIKSTNKREEELAKIDPEDKELLKKTRLALPPYNIDALNQQIVQFEEGIDRCDDVIEQDYNSITEIEKLIGLVEQREKELKSVGS